jgi:hypothetical protein
LLKVLGHRTVPVEVGSNYLADGWGQQMIRFRDFFHAAFGTRIVLGGKSSKSQQAHHTITTAEMNHKHTDSSAQGAQSCEQCPVDTASACSQPHKKRQCTSNHTNCDAVQPVRIVAEALAFNDGAEANVPAGTEHEEILYLAQHSLFDQVPDLRKDIMVLSSPNRNLSTHNLGIDTELNLGWHFLAIIHYMHLAMHGLFLLCAMQNSQGRVLEIDACSTVGELADSISLCRHQSIVRWEMAM